MQVPYVDLSSQYQLIKEDVFAGLSHVFENSQFILGEAVKAFEQKFANYCGVRYGIGVNSGTDALYLALAAYDISVGDEVIVPSYSFIATALCVTYAGAKPVFVDIDESSYNIDPVLFEKAITPRTKAVIPVHLYGQPAAMDDINRLAQRHGIKVIEDAAQSHGAAYKGQPVGSLGDVACFSFYPTKTLGAFGDGGIVLTDDENVYKKLQLLRDYGRSSRYDHKVKGYNSRLDTVQAVVLLEKLKYLDEWNALRKTCAQGYQKRLLDADLILPTTQDGHDHIFQTFAIRTKNRDDVLKGLQDCGVSALIHYPIPIHLQEAFNEFGYQIGDLPVCEKIAHEILSLPIFPHMRESQQNYVCEQLIRIMDKCSLTT